MSFMLGVDVGGTFTDISVFNTEDKSLFNYKLSSTPGDPSRAIVDGVQEVMKILSIRPEDISYLAHGTTVATNALIEKKGAKIGIITTDGFKDLLEIGWQKRPNLYDLLRPKAPRLVQPGMIEEVPERIRYDGSVYEPLDESAVRTAVDTLVNMGAEAIAVCTLFSFLNPAHEKRIKEIILEKYPDLYVTASHELVQEFREYSRMSTVMLNAYLGPVMKKYVQNFEDSVKNVGIQVNPYVTQSNGSIISVSETIECPIRTAVSGPSAGVVGAAYIGNKCGIHNIITFDMGGTSVDVSLIKDGKPQLSSERLVEGHPARIPMIDIVTIGAGGGSIAHIDEGGALKVGPKSAGARPGPACYNRGGQMPAVTDANIYLGKLNQQKILGGRMDVYPELAEQAIQDTICNHSTLSKDNAACGIISVVNANMMRAIRSVSVERGYDAREFTLMAFGGAGPLHACEVAEELNIANILIPPAPGTLCSLGLLMADTKFDLSRSKIMLAKPENLTEVNNVLEALTANGNEMLDHEKIPEGRRHYSYFVDARYERQNYELTVELTDGHVTEEVLEKMISDFHAAHEQSFGYCNRSFNVQLVNFKVSAIGEIEKPDLECMPLDGSSRLPEPMEKRSVLFAGYNGFIETPVYNRSSFVPGLQADGPVIIDQMDCTTVVPPKWHIETDGYGNLRLNRREKP